MASSIEIILGQNLTIIPPMRAGTVLPPDDWEGARRFLSSYPPETEVILIDWTDNSGRRTAVKLHEL